MKCSNCLKVNSPGAVYCVQCGSRLSREAGISYQPVSQVEELQEVRQSLRQVSLRLSTLERQVKAISRQIALEESEARPEPVIPETQPGKPEVELRVEPITPSPAPVRWPGVQPGKSQGMPGPAQPISLQPYHEPEYVERPQRGPQPPGKAGWFEEWQQALPGNWLSRIGIVALFIGLGFLAKLAYDEGWIKPIGQLLIGLLVGALLLWGGHHWNTRYRVWAQALTGGGVAVLYLSVFASYALHGLMPFFPTFALMFLMTIGAVGIALRQDSMAIAIIGMVGAFLVPIILGASDYSDPGTGADGHSPGLLIAYILLLDAGVVWLATMRNWRWFTLLGLSSSLLVYGLWYAESGHNESLLMTQGALTGIFLCFVAATMLFHIAWRRTPEVTDLALMSLNAAAYFAASYLTMWDDYRDWLGTFSLLLAGFYGLLGYLALRRGESNRRLFHFAAGIAIVFLTIAIPIQLHRAWITVAWAAEGAVLTWIASRQSIPWLRLWALGVFGLVLVRLFAFDNMVDQASFRPVLNDDRFLPFALSIVAFYVAAYFLKRDPKVTQPWFFPMMVLVANFLTIWLLSTEIVDFVGRRIIEAGMDHGSYLHIRNLDSARALALVITWSVYGLCLMAAGVRRSWDWLRIASYALIAIAAGTTLGILNHSHAMIERGTSTPVLNYSFGAFAVCACGLYLLAYIIAKNRSRLHEAETDMFPVIVAVANILSLWAMSAEVIIFLGHVEYTRSLVLVSLWSAYGLCLMAVGVWKGWRWLRMGGYALVAIAAGMTLVLLNHSLPGVQRGTSMPVLNHSFGGFAVCVIAFYLLAYAMAKNMHRLSDNEKGILPLLLIAANVLSLVAMSSEVLTYVTSGYGKSMGLTLLWAAYAFVLIVVGIMRKWRWVRVGGLALLAVAIVKLFVVDTFTLESGYRVAAYLTLGVLLLAGGFVYHRYAEVIKGFILNQPPR
jgi:uncharacterized membrane protein